MDWFEVLSQFQTPVRASIGRGSASIPVPNGREIPIGPGPAPDPRVPVPSQMRLDGKREMQHINRRKGLFWGRGEENLVHDPIFRDPNGCLFSACLVYGHNHADDSSGRSQRNPWAIVEGTTNTALGMDRPRVGG